MKQDEGRFHLIYGALLVCSFLIDPFCRSLAAGWRSPTLHVYPAAMAIIWLAVWSRRRGDLERGRRRALEERLKRVEGRLADLERARREETDWRP